MKTFTDEELKVIIEKHGKWLRGENGGGRANLRDADLRDANLRDANLRDANLRDANLRDANLRDADLRDANLRDANLRDADLQDANLLGASLQDADLLGADLRNCVGNHSEIRSLQLETYSITYTSEVMQIGCKRYTFEEWCNFTDQEIIEMDGKTALTFWRKWKDTIFTLIEMAPATPIREKEINNGVDS